MDTAAAQWRARPARRPVDKFEDRRRELAGAALQTLSERGYARTSLREIAQNSDFSHGVLHYYFADKVDLITYCVRQYKVECVQRYDAIVAESTSPDALASGFGEALVTTLVEDAAMHRLWYDLRSQALFEAAFRQDVLDIDATLERMIWQVVGRYGELSGRDLAMPSSRCYAMFDGLFQQALLRHIAAVGDPTDDLRSGALQLLDLIAPARRPERAQRPLSALGRDGSESAPLAS